MCESHGAKSCERGMQVGAMGERTTAAINHEIRGTGKWLSPFLEVCKALCVYGRTMEGGAGNMGSCVKRAKADTRDNGALRTGVREFFQQCCRLDCLLRVPLRGLML